MSQYQMLYREYPIAVMVNRQRKELGGPATYFQRRNELCEWVTACVKRRGGPTRQSYSPIADCYLNSCSW